MAKIKTIPDFKNHTKCFKAFYFIYIYNIEIIQQFNLSVYVSVWFQLKPTFTFSFHVLFFFFFLAHEQ